MGKTEFTYRAAVSSYNNKGKLRDRINAKIDQRHETDSCWLWVAACTSGNDMPVIGISSGKTLSARKILFFATTGLPIQRIRRLCRTQQCVNPWHTDVDGRKIQPSERRKAAPVIRPERLFPSSDVKICHVGHPIIGRNMYLFTQRYTLVNGTIRKRKSPRCRICHYVRMETRTGHSHGKIIRRIEHELETLAGRSYAWPQTHRGTIHKKENTNGSLDD